jgi:hypothetical protein
MIGWGLQELAVAARVVCTAEFASTRGDLMPKRIPAQSRTNWVDVFSDPYFAGSLTRMHANHIGRQSRDRLKIIRKVGSIIVGPGATATIDVRGTKPVTMSPSTIIPDATTMLGSKRPLGVRVVALT